MQIVTARKNDLPTTRQLMVLETVAELGARLGRSPNATEVAEALGMTRAGASHLLKVLEAKGLATDEPMVVSSGKWTPTPEGRRWLRQSTVKAALGSPKARRRAQ